MALRKKVPNFFTRGGTNNCKNELISDQVEILKTVNEGIQIRVSDLLSRQHLLKQSLKEKDQQLYELEERQSKAVDEEKRAVEARHEDQIQAMAYQFDNDTEAMKEAHRTELDRLTSGFKREITRMVESHKHDRQLLIAGFEHQIAVLEDLQMGSSDLEGQLQSLRDTYNDSLRQLSTKCATIEELNGTNDMLQKRVNYLEEIIAWFKRNTGKDIDGLFEDYVSMKRNHDDMALKLGAKEETHLQLGSNIVALEKKNTDLEHSLREVQEESAFLRTVQPQTPRLLLILRLLEISFLENTSNNNIGESDNQEPEVWWPKGLCHRQLDEKCNPADFRDLVNLLPRGPPHDYFYRRLELVACAICAKPKFRFQQEMCPQGKSLASIHEFPGKSSYFPCCYEEVCKSCLLEHIVDFLKFQWWYHLLSRQWINCPACNIALGIRCEADLRVFLEQNGSTEVEKLVRM